MINCGNIYLNGKTFALAFNKESGIRDFFELVNGEYIEPSYEDRQLLIKYYDSNMNRLEPVRFNPYKREKEEIKKKQPKLRNKIIRKLLLAGVLVTITLTIMPSCSVLSNPVSLEKNNTYVSQSIIVKEETKKPATQITSSVADSLMEAINNNHNLTADEKEYLSGYKAFFNDYGNLMGDVNKVYEALNNVSIDYTGIDAGNTLGDYDARNNVIKIYAGAHSFGDLQSPEKFWALFHEFGHVVQFANYDKTKKTTNVSRSITEGVNSLVTFEYLNAGNSVKADYIRTQAMTQVLIEIVGIDSVMNMWLNDNDSEVCQQLGAILGSNDSAKAFLEKAGIVENSTRVMNMMQNKYMAFNIAEIRNLASGYDSFSSKFVEAFNDYCKIKLGVTIDSSKLAEVFDDLKFMEYLEKTYTENLRDVSYGLKGYYEAKTGISIEDDEVMSRYFNIIDEFTILGSDENTLVAVNKPLLNKDRIGDDATLIYYTSKPLDSSGGFNSHFYEQELAIRTR